MPHHRSLSVGVSSGLVLALLASPVAAQSDDLSVDDRTSTPSLDAVLEVADVAAARADALSELVLEVPVGAAQGADEAAEVDEIDDDRFHDLRELEKARGALASRIEQWEIEGERENGMASEVVDALLAGESPAQIGAAHAKVTATAAAERREARKAAREQIEDVNEDPQREDQDQGSVEVEDENEDVEGADVEVDGDE